MTSVVLPIGPRQEYKQWVKDAIDSIKAQTVPVKEVFILDDQAHITIDDLIAWEIMPTTTLLRTDEGKDQWILDGVTYSIWRAPWLLGVSTIFNIGVALADYDLVMFMGSDDILKQECIASIVESYKQHNQKAAWYNVTCELQSGGTQTIPNHAAAVTKTLWQLTGGFPASAAVGGPDAVLLSIMMIHMPDRILQVKDGTPLYWVREHEFQATRFDAATFMPEVISIRNKETERWTPPTWTTP